jgi:DNA-binding NarL/FixJ family response regulator
VSDEIRILIADDHPIVRKGLRMAVEEDAGLIIVGEAADGESALALIETLRPQVAVLDIDMPKLDGFGVAREIHRRRLPVEIIFLTMHAQEDLLRAALDLGVRGYILKDSALMEIVVAVRTVAAGTPYLNSTLTARLLQRQPLRSGGPADRPAGVTENAAVDRLTPTERRIVQLIAADKSSKEIGEELSIHYRTIENHRTNICRKLGLEGSNALLRFALQNKLNLMNSRE